VSAESNEIQEGWRRFLIDYNFAKHYKLPFTLTSTGLVPNNPVLDDLLPSLLVVKLASLLDEALDVYISLNNLVMSDKYRETLRGRIQFLGERGALHNLDNAHKLCDLRNDLAHKSDRTVSWKDLAARGKSRLRAFSS
jgi:hypothetical protein